MFVCFRFLFLVGSAASRHTCGQRHRSRRRACTARGWVRGERPSPRPPPCSSFDAWHGERDRVLLAPRSSGLARTGQQQRAVGRLTMHSRRRCRTEVLDTLGALVDLRIHRMRQHNHCPGTRGSGPATHFHWECNFDCGADGLDRRATLALGTKRMDAY